MSKYAWKSLGILGDDELLVAAGAVIAAFNICENALMRITLLLFPEEDGQRVFIRRDNPQRVNYIRDQLPAYPHADVGELLVTYLDHYEVCSRNRNTVAHSMIRRQFTGDGALGGYQLQKFTKSKLKALQIFDTNAEQMLEIADAIYNNYCFGIAIGDHALTKPGQLLADFPAKEGIAPVPNIPTAPKEFTSG